MIKVITILVAFLTVLSCNESINKDEITGVYVPIDFKNTNDTIWLNSNFIYYRKVYDKNNKLVLSTRSKYSILKDNIVQFYSFFTNMDQDLVRFPELLKDTLGGWQCRLEIINRRLQFCVDMEAESRKYCYKKLQ